MNRRFFISLAAAIPIFGSGCRALLAAPRKRSLHFVGPGSDWRNPNNYREGQIPVAGDILVLTCGATLDASEHELPELESVTIERGSLIGKHGCDSVYVFRDAILRQHIPRLAP